jgi:NAD(P)-dependent dehydrogenase (short-subunit alcohol dehydrogenase family)
MAGNYLVIGGSSGIGLELTRLLISSGQTVFEGSRREIEDDPGVNRFHFTYDVLGADRLPDEIESLDGLAYLPGSINLKPFHRLGREDFLHEYELNVLGAVKVIQECLPKLKKGLNPSIVLFSTVAVNQGMNYHASTASAKGALEALGRTLAAEFAPKIAVNSIAPSLIDTPLANRLLSTPEKVTSSAERHPLKRVGTPEDVARIAHALLTENLWITGQVIHVDGGISTIKSI